MYIGDTSTPDRLLYEVLDNSIDELMNGYCNKITVNTYDDSTIVITDNGRGIPLHPLTLPDGTIVDSIVGICLYSKTGGKFNNEGYDISIGTHGIGLTAVCALSTNMLISIRDKIIKDKVYTYYFQDSKFIQKIEESNNEQYSTKVAFRADSKYFENISYDIEKLLKNMLLISSYIQNSELYYNDKKITKFSFIDYIKSVLDVEKIEEIVYTEKNIKIHVFFDFDITYSSNITGNVNLNLCDGTYLSNVTTLMYNIVKETILPETVLTKLDLTNKLKLYVALTIPDPKYDSQIKSKMTKNVTAIVNKLKNSLLLKLQQYKDLFQTMDDVKSNRKVKQKLNKNTRISVSKDNPLKDCEKFPGDVLYILEGESAGGTLMKIRNPRTEAIYPLSGKINNTINFTLAKLVDKESKINFLLESIGIGSNRYRYNKVRIICDADPDGLHITVLVSILFWKFAPQLIREGRVSVLLPPLYGIIKKDKSMIPIYKVEDIQNHSNYIEVKRFKGLGEMNADQLKLVIRNYPVEYVLTEPNNNEAASLFECISNTEVKKLLCKRVDDFNLDKMFNLINT
jgi:DNA gyrase subunit B